MPHPLAKATTVWITCIFVVLVRPPETSLLGFISGPADFRHVAHHSRPGRTSPSFGLTNNVDDSDKVILRDQAKARKKPSFPGAMPPAELEHAGGGGAGAALPSLHWNSPPQDSGEATNKVTRL